MNDVRERPIVMSGDEVRAILDGRKTQFRRPVKPQPFKAPANGFSWEWVNGNKWASAPGDEPKQLTRQMSPFCPFGVPGDRLWVKEKFAQEPKHPSVVAFSSDGAWGSFCSDRRYYKHGYVVGVAKHQNDGRWVGREYFGPWRSSLHLPRKFSRLTREITDIRLQRVQEISWHDIRNEGVDCPAHDFPGGFCCSECPSLRKAFAALWDSTYPGAWDRNDWCWIVTFSVVKGTKDESEKATETSRDGD